MALGAAEILLPLVGVFVMTGVLVCLSAAVLGVDFGWQPLTDGGVEYIIQIEPQMLDSLQDGESLSSALPAFGHNIRRYRIVVGTAELPHHGEPLPEAPSDEPPAGRHEPETPEASRVGYEEELERVEAFGEAEPRGVASMPIDSPYPSNYERTGMPLPGPILVPPILRKNRRNSRSRHRMISRSRNLPRLIPHPQQSPSPQRRT